MKENNIKELGENNRTKNTFKMFSLKELHYDISTEGATLQWIKLLKNCRQIVGNGLKTKVHQDRKITKT